jgi:hypothetical protein
MTTTRLVPAARLDVAEDRENQSDGPLSRRFGDLATNLIGIGTVALIATSIRVWAGMDVIQTQITGLVSSDARQDQRIEQLRTEINGMRVQIGILTAVKGHRP